MSMYIFFHYMHAVFDVSSFFLAIDSMQLVDGMIKVVVTPSSEQFHFEWKYNGDIVTDEKDELFFLPPSITGNDHVEVEVSSDCGATARANIFVLTNYTSTPTSDAPTIGNSGGIQNCMS